MSEILIGYARPESPGEFGFRGRSDSGPPASRNGRPVCVPLETPLLTIAPTGASKGVSVLIPTLLSTDTNIVVVDPKGEGCQVTAPRRRALGQKVVRLDPFDLLNQDEVGSGDSLNPLDLIDPNSPQAADDALTLATALCPVGDKRDPFWDLTARRIIAGLFLWLAAYAPPELRHLGAARRIANAGLDGLAGVLAAMQRVQAFDGIVGEAANSLAAMPDKTLGSVLATMQHHLGILTSPRVVETLRHSTVPLEAIRRGDPVDLFLVMPVDRLESHRGIVRLWLSAIIQTIARRRVVPERRTLLLVDEAGALGELDLLRVSFAQMRGFGLTPWLMLQDPSQLKASYPDDWPLFVNNAGLIQTFGLRTRLAAETIAAMVGWATDLFHLQRDEQLVALAGEKPRILRRLDYRTDRLFRGLYRRNRYFGEVDGGTKTANLARSD